MKVKKLVVSISLVSLFILVATSMTSGATNESQITNQLIQTYKSMSAGELLSEINDTSSSNSDSQSERFGYAALSLKEKLSDYTDAQFLSILKSKEYNSTTKIVLIQYASSINNGKGITQQKALREMVVDRNNDESVRMNLINTMEVTSEEDIKVLTDIIQNENDQTALLAIKKLGNSNFDKALEITNAILNNRNNYSSEALCGAVKIKAEYFRKLRINKTIQSYSNDKSQFIDNCLSIFKESKDDVVKDTMIFSLSNMMDPDAIMQIIENNSIDNDAKIFCIDQNYSTFVTMLNGTPTVDEINALICAMDIYPIKDLYPMLESKSNFVTAEQKNNFDRVMRKMQTEGNPANPKWQEYYSKQ